MSLPVTHAESYSFVIKLVSKNRLKTIWSSEGIVVDSRGNQYTEV